MSLDTHPTIKGILLPADLKDDATPAFAAALRIALHTRGVVNTVHALAPGEKPHWSGLPGVRTLLVRWGVIPETATVLDFEKLGIEVWFRSVPAHDGPVTALLEQAALRPTDLIVMMAHDRTAVERWLQGNVGEALARQARTTTLFIPESASRVLVHPATGHVHLNKVLIPVADVGSQAAVDAAVALARGLGIERAEGVLLHIGPAETLPPLTLPSHWAWTNKIVPSGAVVPTILDIAHVEGVDLIAMASRGHDGVLDSMRGSTTERVLHGSACPVLMAPLPEMT